MKAPIWVQPVVFLAASIPTLLLLQALDVGGDFRLLLAMAAGAVTTALVQRRLTARGDKP